MSSPLQRTDGPSDLSGGVDGSEGQSIRLNPETLAGLRNLSRSPHPYAFRRTDTDERSTRPTSPDPGTSAYPTPLGSSDKLSSLASRRRPHLQRAWTGGSAGFATPGESGTEADDESFGFGLVKALPPPPLRPHKGLRYTGTTEQKEGRGSDGSSVVASAWLTPSPTGEEHGRAGQDYFTRPARLSRQNSAQGKSAHRSGDEVRAARKRLQSKRRGELARRCVEVVLLSIVVNAVLVQDIVGGRLRSWQRELWTRAALVWGLFLLYPIRLSYFHLTRGSHKRSLLSAFRVPVTFDPAPLLYPCTIPTLVAASLSGSSTAYLLPNIVLGLAALPRQIIPASYVEGITNTQHWFISIVPLILSEHTDIFKDLKSAAPYRLKAPADISLPSEVIVSLYALHHALLPPLQFVTSTSLLQTELHLLSIGLINLLLFSRSPQALILQLMLWFGGVGLFITCGHAVRWGIALARIPKWRLRRAGRIIGARQKFISTLVEGLKSRDGETRKYPDSESEDEDEAMPHPAQSRLDKLRAQFLGALKTNLLSPGETETHSAAETNAARHELPNGQEPTARQRRRRYTMSSFTLKGDDEKVTQSHKAKPKKTRSSTIRYFLSLTPEQATARKWYYAGFVYATILLLILGPIRLLISRQALNKHEAFGWAISYLFGNIPAVRFTVLDWNLGTWIPLPPLYDPTDQAPRFTDQFPNLFQDYLDALLGYLNFLPGPATSRLLLTAYCGVIVAIGILTVLCLSPFIEVDTRRKVFHFTMVALLLPAIAIDPCFISLALALVLAIFLLLELLRASQLPPLSRPIAVFLAPYVDGRDLRGPVVVSHIFLLIGCAIPLWLSMAGVERTPTYQGDPWRGWATEERNISMLSGVICVGLGDAFASLVGRRFGRHKWPWPGGKSLEGSFAFACAVVGGLYLGKALLNVVLYGRIIVSSGRGPFVTASKAALAGTGASLMEAVLTGGNDNVIVPVVLWLLVRALGV